MRHEWFRMSYCEMLMLFKNCVMCLYAIVMIIIFDHNEMAYLVKTTKITTNYMYKEIMVNMSSQWVNMQMILILCKIERCIFRKKVRSGNKVCVLYRQQMYRCFMCQLQYRDIRS